MKKKRTDADIEWQERVRELGCMLLHTGDCWGELQLHHLTDGGRRISHRHVLPLCKGHHHWDSPLPRGHAFGKGKKSWEENHGTQASLFIRVQQLLGDRP